jgi:hypothetical protein
VLAFFDSEDAADQAAKALKDWEKATEYMKVDAIGVLVKDENGEVKEHKLGKRAGKKGMGVGVALGVVAAIPTGGASLLGGAAAYEPASSLAACPPGTASVRRLG